MNRRNIITVIVVFCFVWFVFTMFGNVETHSREAGYQKAIGHPMKYAEVPVGHWRVISVVDKSKQTAVIEQDTEAPPYMHEPKQYLLVTDMMPQMMEENFTFTKGGSQ